MSAMEPPAHVLGGRLPSEGAPPRLIPLVLLVSPLPDTNDGEEYFYDPSPDDHNGNFAAAREFFLSQGHQVASLECPDIAAFQAARPQGVTLTPLQGLPARVFIDGYARLQELALAAAAPVPPLPDGPLGAVVPLVAGISIFDRYTSVPSATSMGPSDVAASNPLPAGAFPGGALAGSVPAGAFPAGAAVTGFLPPGRLPPSAGPPRDFDPSRRPDPDGFDVHASLTSSLQAPRSRYGGFYYQDGRFDPVSPLHYGGGSHSGFHGGPPGGGVHGGPPPARPPAAAFYPPHGGSVYPSTYGGSAVHPFEHVPQEITVDRAPAAVFRSDVPRPGFSHVPASVGPRQGVQFPGASVVSLAHGDLRSSSGSEVTMSFPPPFAPPVGPTGFLHGAAGPPLVPTSSPLVHRYGHSHGIPAPAPAPVPAALPPAPPHVAASRPMDPLKLSPLKDEKAFLDNYDLIQYFLRVPDFSTGRPDDSLITDSSNADASRIWEGQLRLAVKDGSLKYLFDNKGDLYNGRGFEMLAALVHHCRPDSVANAFPSLLSLFNDVQGADEPIHQYRSRFDGIIMELSRCKVHIPQILMVMLFLRSIHIRYAEIVDQFRTRFRSIETATLDSIVEGIKFHDGFTVHERKGSKPSGPRAAAATAGGSSNSDQRGHVWRTPFEWLSVMKRDVIKGRWTRALAGTGICPICHCPDKPWHVPSLCPMLKELHLTIDVLPGPPPAPSAAPAPPTPSGRVATADDSAVGGSSASGSASAPSGLVASVLPSLHVPDEYESDEDFRWVGDESGLDYGDVPSSKYKSSFAGYLPSCNHTQLVSTSCLASSSVSCISLPQNLMTAITSLCKSSIRSPSVRGTAGNLVVADTGATDHMLPEASAFISYKRVHDLSVRMGNNSFVPVLGRGTAVFSLNGKRVLVRNVLHVPGLAVPLYSLRAHLHQRGCGFLGTFDDGFHVYFPSFVLSVDMSSDCHLTYESLGKWVTLDSLHYVQPRCAATLSPSETSASTTAFVPPVAIVEDDDGSSAGDSDDTPRATSSPPARASSGPPPSSLPDQSTTLGLLTGRLEELSRLVQYLVPTPKATTRLSERPLDILPPPSSSSEDLSTPRLLSTMSRDDVLRLVHHEGTSLPSIRPCDTANSSDKKTHWSAEELHRTMGCRKFRNYKHLIQVSRDGTWVDGGEFPPSLGSFATIPKSNKGKALDQTRYKFLDAVHVDIAFGDCLSVGGFRYALILVDRATRYNWTFGLSDLSSASILGAFRKFRASAGSLARCFHCDCDLKLFGTAIQEYLIDASSKIVAAPAGRQSSNGLVESHWKVMVHMGRAYLTEKQMPRTYWFFAITHAARMMNAIPIKIHDRLASPFLLVHGVGHDERTWTPIFSLCFFHHDKDGPSKRSKHQANTLDGIVVGRSPTSNALLVFNPRSKKYYEPDSYRLDSYRLPCSMYPDVKYDGGLFCSLLRDDNPVMEEKYPPGTRVERLDPTSNRLLAGTVMDIPLSGMVSDSSDAPQYTVLFDDGTTASVPLTDMAGLIPSPPVCDAIVDASHTQLPPFLQLNSKITYEHEGQYHKGYLGVRNGIYRFMFKSHVNKRKEDWGVDLPDLLRNWVDLCVEGVLVPGHVSHSFIRVSPESTTFDPVASFVSAVNLHRDCPPSLIKALADSHPDRAVWLKSYQEEKEGIESLGTYKKITLGEYRQLRAEGAPKAIPTMCVLTIKKDENLLPLRAKSRIVVLGNHEDRVWSKSERFAPVLRGDSLRFLVSLAVEKRRVLRQGDCKNAFCQGILPPDEITIVRPPAGDPYVDPNEYWLLLRTLYGLRRSPRHWYDKFNKILQSIGLTPSLEDPCLFTGCVKDPDDPTATPSSAPLSLGLYVDDFVYFSEDPKTEQLFCRLLKERCKVDFMGIVEWFLGVHFSWRVLPDSVSVHMNQSGFAANLVESFFRDSRDQTHTATPYRSGIPIDAISPSTDPGDSPAQTRRKEAYQSLVGSIGWLAMSTRPDIAAVHSFLASYSNKPAPGHMKAALYALHYIHSTFDYGISFTSDTLSPMHSYIHHPPSTDVEAYNDAIPPQPSTLPTISAYSDACWGSQIGNAVAEGTLLPLFKFRSMNGGIVFRNGGPIGWLGERQERTSLSSCEAEIRATSATSKKVVDFRNLCRSVSDAGLTLQDTSSPTVLYNDNNACVQWSYNMTSKAARHIELRENSVREFVQDKIVKVVHVAGKTNPADIFTKEMRDGAHFRRLRDSFMSRLSDFLSGSMLAVHHARQQSPSSDTPAAARVFVSSAESPYLQVLASSSFFRTVSNISHLSSAGRQLLRRAHGFVPSCLV